MVCDFEGETDARPDGARPCIAGGDNCSAVSREVSQCYVTAHRPSVIAIGRLEQKMLARDGRLYSPFGCHNDVWECAGWAWEIASCI